MTMISQWQNLPKPKRKGSSLPWEFHTEMPLLNSFTCVCEITAAGGGSNILWGHNA